VGAFTPQPRWPTDPDHREAIQTLLLMAEAEDRWGEPRRARSLLDNVEEIIGELPHGYARMRARCRGVSTPLVDGP
jgi:hypothetical protein